MQFFTPFIPSNAIFLTLLAVLTVCISASGDGVLAPAATEQSVCAAASGVMQWPDVDHLRVAPEVSQDGTDIFPFADTSANESVPLAISQAKRTLSLDRLSTINGPTICVMGGDKLCTLDAVLASLRPVSLILLNIRLQV